MKYNFFSGENIWSTIRENGYIKLSLMTESDIDKLKSSFKVLKEKAGNSLSSEFWPSGRHPDADLRNFAKNSIEEVVPPILEKITIKDKVRLIGGTYLVKPPSRKSSLSPHQDSSHVDERYGFSVYCWIPLNDVNKWNGCFHFLPDSHNWGIHQRSLNVKWPLKDKTAILQKYMKPIPMKAGEVLLFHSALIHSSPPNYTFKTRVAVNYYLHPSESPFCHFYEDENTPKGKVEMYSVTPEFFYNENFESKPDTNKYPLLDIIEKSQFDWNTIENKLKNY